MPKREHFRTPDDNQNLPRRGQGWQICRRTHPYLPKRFLRLLTVLAHTSLVFCCGRGQFLWSGFVNLKKAVLCPYTRPKVTQWVLNSVVVVPCHQYRTEKCSVLSQKLIVLPLTINSGKSSITYIFCTERFEDPK